MMTQPHVEDRLQSMNLVIEGLNGVRERLRKERASTWGRRRSSPTLKDYEVAVLSQAMAAANTPRGHHEEIAAMDEIQQGLTGYSRAGVRLGLDKLVNRGLMAVAEWPDAYVITRAGWAWLRENDDKIEIRVPPKPPSDDIPF